MNELKENGSQVKLHKYVGLLEFYYETGMEGTMGVIFHDDRGNHEGPKWDKPDETMIYRSLAWSIWFGDRFGFYNIRIFDKENNIVYEGPLSKDKKKMKADDYRLSFIPKEIDKKDWIKYCQNEYRGELYSNQLTSAMQEEFKNEFKIGEMVHDDLTGKDVVLLHVTMDKNKNLGYWIKDGGNPIEGRLPQELSAINWKVRFDEEQKKWEEEKKND